MSEYTVDGLRNLPKHHDFFIGIDSDGCVFDSMEIKHKECFCPAFINHFDLQPVAKYAREAWDFVNLYSTTRGANRFVAVLRALDLLADRSDVVHRGVVPPQLAGLRDWVSRETKLGNPVLQAVVAAGNDPDLKCTLAWSLAVNEAVELIVRNVPPFPLVRESLSAMREQADVIVVSQTPTAALVREWDEQQIDDFVSFIAGQEIGSKSEHLRLATEGRYAPDKILMIGDAPGDYKAAQAVGALFYPINPGAEEAGWQRLYDESLARFFAGRFAGVYQEALLAEFDTYLPAEPAWSRVSKAVAGGSGATGRAGIGAGAGAGPRTTGGRS